ncbi:MAG: hypothetical protein IPJ38_00105 [Dechloromonas sp.]|uniref:Uncharacterized protein n=1 Tax=Candidatus Dechloromonas phosphorivorans TaxID=2899244 RepID=A0A935K0Y4_9RHOO|nr:hypothetical protein [Candidatus Dechloromonas phosphorivorans]
MADVLDQRTQGQFFQLRFAEPLLATKGNDQRRRGYRVFGGIGIHLLEPGERDQRIRVAHHRLDHPMHQRFKQAGIDMNAGPGSRNQIRDRLRRFR